MIFYYFTLIIICVAVIILNNLDMNQQNNNNNNNNDEDEDSEDENGYNRNNVRNLTDRQRQLLVQANNYLVDLTDGLELQFHLNNIQSNDLESTIALHTMIIILNGPRTILYFNQKIASLDRVRHNKRNNLWHAQNEYYNQMIEFILSNHQFS